MLRHDIGGETVYSLYAHMQSPSPLATGTQVTQGQPVGQVGNTGVGTGPHLHFEAIRNQPNPLKRGHQTYDPANFDFPTEPPLNPDTPLPDIPPDQPPPGPNAPSEWPPNNPASGGMGSAAQKASPIILDLDGDGVEATDFAVQVDHDGNGFAERSAIVNVRNRAL